MALEKSFARMLICCLLSLVLPCCCLTDLCASKEGFYTGEMPHPLTHFLIPVNAGECVMKILLSQWVGESGPSHARPEQ